MQWSTAETVGSRTAAAVRVGVKPLSGGMEEGARKSAANDDGRFREEKGEDMQHTLQR